MAVGYHSRAFHGSSDPTSTPTAKGKHGGHIEVLAAKDKGGGQNTLKGMAKPNLYRKTLANKGERP